MAKTYSAGGGAHRAAPKARRDLPLRWQNWDEDRQMPLVRHTLAKGENGGFVLRDNPKDPSGRDAFRDIPVPSTLATALATPKRATMDRPGDFYG